MLFNFLICIVYRKRTVGVFVVSGCSGMVWELSSYTFFFKYLNLTLDMLVSAQENCFLFEEKNISTRLWFLISFCLLPKVLLLCDWGNCPGPLGPWGVFLVSIHISINLSKNYWFQLTVSIWIGLYLSL